MRRFASTCHRALALGFLFCISSSPWALELLTEENPPFNYTDNKKVVGQATEVVTEMARRAGVQINTQVMVWATAYTKAQGDKDTCLYSTARLSNRENLFKWVGPIAVNHWALFAKVGFAGKLTNAKDAIPYRIGGVTRDAKIEFLRQQGVTNIVEADKDSENPPKLTLDRKAQGKIDLWVTTAARAQDTARAAGVTDLKQVLVLVDEPLYLACSPRTAPETLKKLAAALAEMEKDGSLKKLRDRPASK